MHATELKYLQIQLSAVLLEAENDERPLCVVSDAVSSPSTPGETGASVAFFIVS